MLTGPHIKKLNFDRCDHRVLGTCSTQADGCCGVVACNLCIEITSDYTDEIVERKVAPFSSPGYAATLGNVVFEAYWRRDYVTGECVFIVEVTDAVETQVLEFSKCYDAASCMAPAGSVAIQYDGESHVLSWEPLDVVTLKHRVEGKCNKPFCGECTCAPREICVTLTIGGCTVSERVALEPSECKEEDPPVWEFTLVCPDGGPTISGTVSLRREEYTNACILNVVIPEHYIDYDYEWLECPDIDDFEFTFSLPLPEGYFDATISIRSADCDLCINEWGICICDGEPIASFTLTIFSSLISGDGIVGQLTMRRALLPLVNCQNQFMGPGFCEGYYGSATMNFPIGMGFFEEDTIEIRHFCRTECSNGCFEYRYGSRDVINANGWNSGSLSFDVGGCDSCPNTFLWTNQGACSPADSEPCENKPGYQVTEFLAEADDANCD